MVKMVTYILDAEKLAVVSESLAFCQHEKTGFLPLKIEG
jgi:hypothetical protein